MDFSTLCETLLPQPVLEEVNQINQTYHHAAMERYWRRLLSPQAMGQGR